MKKHLILFFLFLCTEERVFAMERSSQMSHNNSSSSNAQISSHIMSHDETLKKVSKILDEIFSVSTILARIADDLLTKGEVAVKKEKSSDERLPLETREWIQNTEFINDEGVKQEMILALEEKKMSLLALEPSHKNSIIDTFKTINEKFLRVSKKERDDFWKEAATRMVKGEITDDQLLRIKNKTASTTVMKRESDKILKRLASTILEDFVSQNYKTHVMHMTNDTFALTFLDFLAQALSDDSSLSSVWNVFPNLMCLFPLASKIPSMKNEWQKILIDATTVFYTKDYCRNLTRETQNDPELKDSINVNKKLVTMAGNNLEIQSPDNLQIINTKQTMKNEKEMDEKILKLPYFIEYFKKYIEKNCTFSALKEYGEKDHYSRIIQWGLDTWLSQPLKEQKNDVTPPQYIIRSPFVLLAITSLMTAPMYESMDKKTGNEILEIARKELFIPELSDIREDIEKLYAEIKDIFDKRDESNAVCTQQKNTAHHDRTRQNLMQQGIILTLQAADIALIIKKRCVPKVQEDYMKKGYAFFRDKWEDAQQSEKIRKSYAKEKLVEHNIPVFKKSADPILLLTLMDAIIHIINKVNVDSQDLSAKSSPEAKSLSVPSAKNMCDIMPSQEDAFRMLEQKIMALLSKESALKDLFTESTQKDSEKEKIEKKIQKKREAITKEKDRLLEVARTLKENIMEKCSPKILNEYTKKGYKALKQKFMPKDWDPANAKTNVNKKTGITTWIPLFAIDRLRVLAVNPYMEDNLRNKVLAKTIKELTEALPNNKDFIVWAGDTIKNIHFQKNIWKQHYAKNKNLDPTVQEKFHEICDILDGNTGHILQEIDTIKTMIKKETSKKACEEYRAMGGYDGCKNDEATLITSKPLHQEEEEKSAL